MITNRTTKALDRLDSDLQKAVAANGFSVLAVHDLQAKLQAKGVPFARTCRIYEVCNPHKAKIVLEREMAISTALPCRIAVYDKDGQLELATMEPTQLLTIFGHPELESVAREVEDTMRSIMAQATEVPAAVRRE